MHIQILKKQACLMIGLVFLLSSCGGTQSKKALRTKTTREDLRFQEAKLSDIPVLLDAVRLENDDIAPEQGQTILQFSSTSPQEEVVHFYEQEMERMGWQQLSSFKGQENFLLFEKPYTIALIMVRERAKKKTTRISILLSMKEFGA